MYRSSLMQGSSAVACIYHCPLKPRVQPAGVDDKINTNNSRTSGLICRLNLVSPSQLSLQPFSTTDSLEMS
ncbi:hypothetical protein E2C01_055646 [Portunus trituberculatus]|uniref:Uncharacterized protein n=1 Tax=Portunus trituberculatus TaxID=210409 RepID=A0A5B7GRT2_PORTR|nr:hypothetical protein [Portunus trituberculatus]